MDELTPIEALDLLPGVFQSIGKLIYRLKYIKPTSKLGIELWNRYEELNNYGAELSFIIRMALRMPEIKKIFEANI